MTTTVVPVLRVLNLGAGVQSSTLALMATKGFVGPMPDCAIFADTGWEPKEVYVWLADLKSLLPFPVHVVKCHRKGATGLGIRHDALQSKRKATFSSMPFFTESAKGEGRLRRQCTNEYKIEPIQKKCRELLGVGKGERIKRGVVVEQWFGISTDEIYRVKPSAVPWIERRWPLVFDVRMTRQDCIRWMADNGYPRPPRSACIGCPFHSDAEWRSMRETRPDEWADAVDFDARIRDGVRGTKERIYLHRSLKPLSEADISTPEDHGQLSLFTDECEGMCGV